MAGRIDLRRAVPWVLCWISVALLVTGAGLRIALPEGVGDEFLYVAVSTLSVALVPLVGGEVATGLRDTVVATVAPTRVAVWLRMPPERAGAQP